MPEPRYHFYEVHIAGGNEILFDGRFRYSTDAVAFISDFLLRNGKNYITDIYCTEIGTETDLLDVRNV